MNVLKLIEKGKIQKKIHAAANWCMEAKTQQHRLALR